MTIFDRHIIRRLLLAYGFLTLALIIFFILLHYLEYIDDFLDRKAPLREIYTIYYPSYIPEIIRLVSPLSLYLSCIFVTGKLTQTMQITALQTSGISLYRLLFPYTLVACLVTGMMLWFNGWIVPITNQTVLTYDSLYLKDAPRQMDTSDIHRQNNPSSFLSVGYYNSRNNTAHRVSLQYFDQHGQLVRRIDSQRMVWQDSLWQLSDAVVRTFEGSEEKRSMVSRLDTMLQVFPRDLARTERDIESMTIPVAARYIQGLRRSGASNTGRPEVGYYTKFSYPLANFIVVLLALPLTATLRSRGQTVHIGTGLFIAFAYLATQKLLEPFGYSGELSPMFIAFAPHVLFCILACIMLVRTRK